MSDSGSLTRDVVLRLKTESLVGADFKTITDQVNTLTAAIDKETAAAKAGAITQAELAQNLNKLKDAGKGLENLAGQIQIFKNFETQITAQTAKVREAADALAAFQARIDSGERIPRAAQQLRTLENAVTRTTNALTALQNAQAAQGSKLQQAGIDTNNLAASTQQLLTVVDQTGAGIRTLDSAVVNYTKNLREHNAEVKRQKEENEKATRAAEQLAIATKKLADEAERVKQAQALAGVQAGTAELTRQRDEAQKKLKAEADFQAAQKKGMEDIRNARMEEVRKGVEANNKAHEKAYQDERARNADMEKLRQQALAGLAGVNAHYTEQQQQEVRKNVEENNRIREQQIVAEREADRRASLGRLGRLREDFRNARQARRQDAEEQARERQQSGRGFLGLQSYQVTNLGYQATDVVQGFLQGVNPATIAAQQGPQIFQIFGMAALKWSPVIVAALGAITVAVGAFSRAYREVASNREFNAAMQSNVNSLNYSITQLTALRKEARDMGMSWKDAGDSIKIAMTQNIPQERLKEFLQAAQDAADLGKDTVPDAMKKFTEAFSSSSDGILRLNESYNFLNPMQQRYIRDLIESGRTEQARIYALEKLTETLRKAAKEGIDPTVQSVRTLSQAWDDMLVSIGKSAPYNTAHTALVMLIDDIGGLFKEIDRIIKSKNPWSEFWASFWAVPMDPIKRGLTSLFRPTPAPQPGQTTPSATAADAGRAALAPDIRKANENAVRDFLIQRGYSPEAIAGIMGNIAVESGFNPAIRNATGHFGLAQWDRTRQAALGNPPSTDIIRQMELLDQELQKLDPAFKKATGSAADMALRFEKVFERSGGQLNDRRVAAAQEYAGTAVQGAPTSTQTQEGERQVRRSKEQLEIDQARTPELERQARYRQAEAEINQRNIDADSKRKLIADEKAKIDQDIFTKQKTLEEKRETEKITFARHYNEVVAAGNKEVEEALKTQNLGWQQIEAIRDRGQQREFDRLSRIDQQNKAFDAAVKSVNDLERALRGAFGPDMQGRLDALGAQFDDRIKQLKELREAATLTEKGRIDELISRVQGLRPLALFEEQGRVLMEQAKDAVAARDNLVAANKALREAGIISIGEQQERDAKAFGLVKTAIDDATKSLDAWIEKGKEMGVPTIKLEQTRAEVQKLRVESEYIDPLWKGLVKTAEDSFGTRAVETFDSVSQAIGEAIAKTKEWKDVWLSMRNAAANFFAGILKDLAQYIIKAELAKVMSSFIPSLSGFPGAASAASAVASGTASQLGVAGASAAATGGMSAGWTSILSGAAAVIHEGGVIGRTQLPRRAAPAYWFDNAPRFHNGGLAANEQAAIVQTGEEILTANNPRHIRNWGGGAAPDINIRNVLVADPNLVPSHMASSRGERIIMNTLTKNAATVRQLVR